MPLTGNQANLARMFQEENDIADDPWVINQLTSAFNGYFGLRVRFIAYNDATNYALEVRNLDGTNGRSLVCFSDTGANLLEVVKARTIVAPELMVTTSGGGTILFTVNSGGITSGPSIHVTDSGGGKLLDMSATTINIATGVTADVHIGETTGNVYIGTVNANATDIFIGGTSSYFSVTAANVDFTTSGYFHINGVTPYSSANPPPAPPTTIARLNWTGSGGSSATQKTCGFTAKWATIAAWGAAGVTEMYTVHSTGGSLKQTDGSNITQNNRVKLHGSDGIIVADGATDGNVSGRGYDCIVYG